MNSVNPKVKKVFPTEETAAFERYARHDNSYRRILFLENEILPKLQDQLRDLKNHFAELAVRITALENGGRGK